MARKQVERPFCGSRWTRARFFAFIRSALRLASRKWPPRIDAKVAARRHIKVPGRSKRQKWEFTCSQCGGWFPDKEVEVDHIIPLQGKLVSGLHTPTNLQVITARDNAKKGRKYLIS